LKWGTGGIDIDGSRVESSQEDKEIMDNKAFKNPTTNYSDSPDKIYSAFAEDKATPSNPIGRFPANLILSYPENEYTCKDNLTKEQIYKLYKWLNENT
jgi:hypothetical protein